MSTFHLQHLAVTAFQGVSSLATDLSPLTLVAGSNGAGKTSLLQAIRFALCGDVDRVALKKDYPLLVTDGASKARIELVLDAGEVLTATLPNGKGGEAIEAGSPAALALDPPAFMRLKANDRRTLLFNLAGDMGNVSEIARKRLQDAAIPPPMAEEVMTVLRGGFPAAFQHVSQRLTEARGAWRGVTGEVYGSQKAEGWRPSDAPVAPSREALTDAQAAVETAEADLADANESLGRAKAMLTAEDRATLESVAATLPDLQAHLDAGEAELATLRAQKQALAETAEQSSGICFDCPACKAALRYSAGQVTERTASAEDATQASYDIIDLGRRIASLTQSLGVTRAQALQAQAAADRLAAAAAEDGNGLTVDDLSANAEDARAVVASARAALEALRRRETEVEACRQKIANAEKWHLKIKSWAEVSAIVAPDGLPQELLAYTLRPVNESLRDAPEGWPVIQIRGDMELTVNGRPYGLCSESEQWRADVAMAVWLAKRSGSGLVLADRMDVLAPSARVPFLAWAEEVASDDGVQIIVAATLGSEPNLGFARVLWIDTPVMEKAA